MIKRVISLLLKRHCTSMKQGNMYKCDHCLFGLLCDVVFGRYETPDRLRIARIRYDKIR